MSSTTYTLSQFINICNVTPEEAIAIIKSDIWFELNKMNSDIERYIKFSINNKKISFINRSNIMVEEFIKIDKKINLDKLTIDIPLTIEELASVIFSVNGNYKVFNLLKTFFVNLKKNDISNFEILKTNKKMKIFCAHIAYLIANTEFETKIPDWLMEDSLLIEEIKMFESIHLSKFKISNIPLLEKFDKLFVSSLYLSFIIVYDRARDMQLQQAKIPQNISKLLHGTLIDLNKANNILKII
jgi:hypothetical protein